MSNITIRIRGIDQSNRDALVGILDELGADYALSES